MIKLWRINKTVALFLVFVLLITGIIEAQCPMCRMSAESNLAHGGTEGRGLNNGILYLLSLPYILVMVLGFIWWRSRKGREKEEG